MKGDAELHSIQRQTTHQQVTGQEPLDNMILFIELHFFFSTWWLFWYNIQSHSPNMPHSKKPKMCSCIIAPSPK
jgi:hypothetical protein